MAKDDYAVLVGINDYPAIGNLLGPGNDVALMRQWLEEKEGGDVPANNIQKVLSSDFPPAVQLQDSHPLIHDIDAAYGNIISRARQNQGKLGRRLYMYFAGHGITRRDHDTVLLAANTTQGELGYHIPGRAYAEWFQSAAIFDEIVLIMDCCRNFEGNASLRPPPWDTGGHKGRVSIFIAWATQPGLRAREQQQKNGLVGGNFTVAFIEALRCASRDENGAVTDKSVKAFVYNYWKRHRDANIPEPSFVTDGRDIIFGKPQVSPITIVRIQVSPSIPDADLIIRDGSLKEVHRTRANSSGHYVQLPTGLFKAEVEGTDRSAFFEVVGMEPVNVNL